MILFHLNLLEIVLLALLLACFLVHLYYVLFVHLKLVKYQYNEKVVDKNQPISVIIAARNEVENLRNNLSTILTQDYSEFEVIVVNDRSNDETEFVLKSFCEQYKNLKIVTVNHQNTFLAGKKFAVAMGVKAAKYDWLVFTDADCKPSSNQWLQYMQKPDTNGTDILLGYSPYIKSKGFLNALIRFETFFTAINYLSYALKNNPYMGVGRNMAYRKGLFFESKGFASHMHIPSGDDDLFVNENATAKNTKIQIAKESFVWTEAKTSWLAYLKQKKRHYGAGKHYKYSHRLMLSIQSIFQLLFYVLLITLLFFPHLIWLSLTVFGLSVIIKSFVYPRLLNKLANKDLVFWYPLLDVLLAFFLVFNAIAAIFVKKIQWK